MRTRTMLALAALSAAGCTTFHEPKGYAPATTLSLIRAICEVQESLKATRRHPDDAAGMRLGEATVELALAAKETTSGEVSVGLPIATASLGGKSARGLEQQASNKLFVKFTSDPAYNDVNIWSLVATGAKKDLQELQTAALKLELEQIPKLSKRQPNEAVGAYCIRVEAEVLKRTP